MQAVDHPYLVVHSATAPGAAEATKKLQEAEAECRLEGLCGVCHDPLEDPVVSNCQHPFCRACISEYMDAAQGQGQTKCPTCEKPLSVDLSSSASVSLVNFLPRLVFIQSKGRAGPDQVPTCERPLPVNISDLKMMSHSLLSVLYA